MSISSEHPSYVGRLSRTTPLDQYRVAAEPGAVYKPARRYSQRACCCLAKPAVIAVMPPAAGRRAPTDLLLCGHHFRKSQAALVTHGAQLLDVLGHPLKAETWPAPS